jgi:hypothetical protein
VAFVHESDKWYLADIVELITVQDDPRNVVHTNTVLVRADSPEEAYEKAIELGAAGNQSYENPSGKRVTIRFIGLRNLTVIQGELEHGAELIYSESIGVDETAIRDWITPKESLGVFAPIKPSSGPNYSSGDVMEEVRRIMTGSADPDPGPTKVN